MTEKCLVCGSTGVTMTKEDVIPVWLLKVIKDFYGSDSITLSTNSGYKRNMRARRYMVPIREVCAECNHGWLHDLEAAFRVVAIPAIRATDLAAVDIRLDEGAQTVFATWALKTWFLLQRAMHHATSGSAQSKDAIHYLYEHGQPPHDACFVYVGTVNLHASAAIQVHTTRMLQRSTGLRGVISIMSIRGLAFVIAVPESESAEQPGIVTGPNARLEPALTQIWPHKFAEVRWPTAGVMTEAFIDRLFPAEIVWP